MVATFADIVGKVKLRCPDASQFLAEDWVRTAFQEIAHRKRWSWLYGFGQFLMPAVVNTGTVTVSRGSTIVIGSGTTWTDALVGRQFRTGTNAPIYTIQQVLSTTSLVLDSVWGGATASAQRYQIYLCYVTPPSDFQSFISVWDPNFNWQLVTDYTQNQLNAADAQRANTGNAYLLAWRDYTTNSIGSVAPPLQANGSGATIGSSGYYSGPNNALFRVEILAGGIAGTATFQWFKDDGSASPAVTSSVIGSPQFLQDNVSVYFPTDGSVFVSGDIFVIQALAGSNPGTPRYEIWPHQTAEYVYPYLYWKKYPDVSDPGVTIPRQLDTALIQERALADAAMWPGPTGRTNSYYRLELSDRHMKQYEYLLNEADRNDAETFMIDVQYQEVTAMPFAPIPALGDSNFLQSHDW